MRIAVIVAFFLSAWIQSLQAHSPLVDSVSAQQICEVEERFGVIYCGRGAACRGGLEVPALFFCVPGPVPLREAKELFLCVSEVLSCSVMRQLRCMYCACPIQEYPLFLSLIFRDCQGCGYNLPFLFSVYNTEEQIVYQGKSPGDGRIVTVQREDLWQAINEYQHQTGCNSAW